MTTSARTAPFAHYLGISKPNAAKPARSKSSPSKGPKAPAPTARKRAKRPAQDTPSSFAHLVPAVAQKPKTTSPQQRAASRGAAAREIVRAYEQSQPAQPTGRQTSPRLGAAAERDLAQRIIAAGKRRRAEG